MVLDMHIPGGFFLNKKRYTCINLDFWRTLHNVAPSLNMYTTNQQRGYRAPFLNMLVKEFWTKFIVFVSPVLLFVCKNYFYKTDLNLFIYIYY